MKFEKNGAKLQICRNKETQIYCEVKRQTSTIEKKTIQTKMTNQKGRRNVRDVSENKRKNLVFEHKERGSGSKINIELNTSQQK